MRSLADALTFALTPAKTRALKAGVLPRGTNSVKTAQEAVPNKSRLTTRVPAGDNLSLAREYFDLTPVHHVPTLRDSSPEYREAVRRNLLGLPNTVVAEAIRESRKCQATKAQSGSYEDHMSVGKHAKAPFKTAEQLGIKPQPYPAQPVKVDVNPKLARLRADTALRNRIRAIRAEEDEG